MSGMILAPMTSLPANGLPPSAARPGTLGPQRRQYYLHHFLKSRPALNWRESGGSGGMLDVGRYWLDIGRRRFFVSNVIQLSWLSRSELPRQSTAASGYAPCPTGLRRGPFFQFVTPTPGPGRKSVEIVETTFGPARRYPERTSLPGVVRRGRGSPELRLPTWRSRTSCTWPTTPP